METLAYLQVAQDFEDPESKDIVFLKDSLALFKSVSGLKLPSQTLFVLLGVACSAFVWNLAGSAQAIVLQRGDTGSDVSYLQNLLNDNGYSVPVTGYYGTQTEDQVFNFQADFGLSADGVAGDSTFAELEFRPINPAPGSGGGAIDFGDSGDAVLDVQYLLSDNGYFSGPFTGYFGSSTEQAVINFQSDYGLSADGVVGSATLSALRSGGDFPGLQPSNGTLSFGDSGTDVEELQRLLTDNGYPVGITGEFATLTEQQVRNFQYDNYLTVDGVAGPATLTALRDGGFQGVLPDGGLGTSASTAEIQRYLSNRGYYFGAIDGVYGSATSDAVARFQRDLGITADGIWGPETASYV
ncbi:peptidoglycan-binding protein [Phormidium tenue FACHB-886]|nr:peptidoglycan-binding protein [Phormidium tenue FACHB-886]